MTANVLLAKTTKIAEHGLPKTSAFYDDYSSTMPAKARKAGRVAELSAMGDVWVRQNPESHTFKLVGAGSYQRVVFYATEHTAGRERLRGTCQACARLQVVDRGVLVLHGYQRPGDGQIFGRCLGQKVAPAEVSVVLTHGLIADLTATVASLRTSLADVERKLAAFWKPILGRDTAMTAAEHKTSRELDEQKRRLEGSIWANTSYVAMLTTRALPQHGRPLATEVVAS